MRYFLITLSKILRIITRLNIGGPARQALLITKALADVYPTVLAAGFAPGVEGELSDPQVPVQRLPLVRPFSPFDDARAFAGARALLRSHQPKLVHTHMAKAGAIGRGAALTFRQRPRLVHTFHGHVLDGYFSFPVQWAATRTERWLARRTDVLVAVSPEIRDQLLQLEVGRPDQYRVIPVGIDLGRHAQVAGPQGALRAKVGIGPRIPLVGSVGRLAPIKDHVTLLRAMAELPEVHLAIVGDGELRSELEMRARDLGLAERVHFTGWWEDVPVAMSDLDVVVLTSRNEGTPVSLIEALACGRPVVATDVGGVASVIRDGVNGSLARPADWLGIAAAIRGVLDDLPAAEKKAQAGRREICLRFGQDRLIEDIKALYDELLQN